MNKLVVTIVVMLLVSTAFSLRNPFSFRHKNSQWNAPKTEDTLSYTTLYYTQTLDHFNFQVGGTFQQRYLVNDQYLGTKNMSASCAGPVLFYTGNEGDVTEFWENSGFITQVLAPEFGALVVFAEHRYYGESYPFGKVASYEIPNIGYLTTEQALADYASLIRYLKFNSTYADQISECPVIAFGGSYGGMLTAWLRMKYPTLVAGGLASSAPIGWFLGAGVPDLQYVYAKIVTQDYTAVSPSCSNNIQLAFETLISLSQTSSGLQQIQNIFHLCDPLTADLFYSFLGFVEGAYDTMAQYDYPYPATFAGDMPGWPVNVACSFLTPVNPSDTSALLTALFNGMNVYYNTSGTAGQCYPIHNDEDPYAGSWGYQTCTEMVMPYASNGVTDMFFPDPWNFTQFQEECYSRWKVQPLPSWAVLQWGGLDVKAASNIFFSNGRLDPYSGGGVLQSSVPSLPALYIEDSAHHLDLRSPNPADPPSIREARELEKSYIETWIKQYLSLPQQQ